MGLNSSLINACMYGEQILLHLNGNRSGKLEYLYVNMFPGVAKPHTASAQLYTLYANDYSTIYSYVYIAACMASPEFQRGRERQERGGRREEGGRRREGGERWEVRSGCRAL